MTDKTHDRFFKKFGMRCQELRLKRGWTQEDMLDHGFGTRHYQRIEHGLAVSMTTGLRLARAFGVKLSALIRGIE